MAPPSLTPLRPRTLSSNSSSSVSDEGRRGSRIITPDRCKGCLRLFTKMLTIKQCFRCKNYMCALCVFKVPMFHGEKGKLPKHGLHARLCATCYDESILNENNNQPEMSPPSGRDNLGLFEIEDECEEEPVIKKKVVQTPSAKTTLWLSILAGSLMMGIVLLENVEFSLRIGAVVLVYGAFVIIHPLWKISTPSENTLNKKIAQEEEKIEEDEASTCDKAEPVDMDAITLEKKSYLETRWDELKNTNEWVKNDSRSTSAITLSELDCGPELPLCIKVEALVTDISPDDLLAFLSSPDPKDRIKWDTGMTSHKVIQEITLDATIGQIGRILHNVQKAHGFGVVSSRDFVSFAYRASSTLYLQGSLVHPNVPNRAGSTRGNLHILGFECTPAEDGFLLTYINHIDIGGALPRKLVTSGTCDNMMKFMNSAIQAKKKWQL
ncbi:hypothetical protein THRCLA_06277 [Thraustotheca clavata]|uniref:START domain-containing protein n=1 Tax=Thraustotheca clavata TaxID=74557 RepID=A0A1V9ZQ25_9STRA|nr:hypothetical protein THRCLA_06277 [Thraustotheca clavata]